MKTLTRKILFTEDFFQSYFAIPIVIRLRELRENFSDNHILKYSKIILYQFIAKQFIINTEEKNEDFHSNKDGILQSNILTLIGNLRPVIIIDGFDEIGTQIRDDVFAQIKGIAYKARNCKIILTSRTGEFSYQIENFSYYEIAPFNQSQIQDYSIKFLGEEKGKKFYNELNRSTYLDIASKPLLLSFLCAIYFHSEELPEKPRYIYAEIIDILFNKWDRSRGIIRKSKFSSFGKEEKIEFLTILSFKLLYSSKITFDKFDIIQIYNSICEKYELDKKDAEMVFSEIEEHSGLFIQSGADIYEFPHKSVQEYLAAKYLLTITNLSKLHSLTNIPHECALMVALSANPNERLNEILGNVTFENHRAFVSAFFERLVSENPRFETSYRTAFEISKFLSQGSSAIRAKTYDIAFKLVEINSLKKSYRDLQNHFKVKDGIVVNYREISNEESKDFVQLVPVVVNKKWKKQKVYPFKIHKLFLKEWE